ncbi:MAG: AAA family ATPase [Chitinophagales bacterium]
MKETLIVKDFGPIKDVELDLRKTTVFIGPQGSGKSTLAKLIAIFRDWDFLKQFNLLDEKKESLAHVSFFQRYNIHNYFQFDTKTVNKKTDFYHSSKNGVVKFSNDSFTVSLIDEFKDTIQVNLDNLQKLMSKLKKFNDSLPSNLLDEIGAISNELNNFKGNLPLYIPTERFLIPIISPSLLSFANNNISLPKYLTGFGTYFEYARLYIPYIKIDYLGLAYKYENNLDKIVLENNQTINLSESASGFQALIPLHLVIAYYATSNKENYDYSFIIEEPELNLYPTTQKDLIYYLSDKCTKGENDLVITTHSPYTLSSFNNLLFAYQTAQKHPEQREAIKAIIPEESWMNPDDFAAYYIDSDGTTRSIFNRKTGLIAENELDDISEIMAEEFDELMEIYRSPRNESTTAH